MFHLSRETLVCYWMALLDLGKICDTKSQCLSKVFLMIASGTWGFFCLFCLVFGVLGFFGMEDSHGK